MGRNLRLAVLLSAVVFLYGCALAWVGVGAGIGVGTYRYIQGNVEMDYSLEYNSAWDAVNTALANRYISIVNSLNEGSKGSIEAIQKNGKRLTITLHYLSEEITTIKVRVGLLGSSEDAEALHEEIMAVAGLK